MGQFLFVVRKLFFRLCGNGKRLRKFFRKLILTYIQPVGFYYDIQLFTGEFNQQFISLLSNRHIVCRFSVEYRLSIVDGVYYAQTVGKQYKVALVVFAVYFIYAESQYQRGKEAAYYGYCRFCCVLAFFLGVFNQSRQGNRFAADNVHKFVGFCNEFLFSHVNNVSDRAKYNVENARGY